jgi:hypothetical protein
MTLAALDLPPITFHKAAHFKVGRERRVRAIVNHRMVGTLPGTTAYFQNDNTRPVSTHFGIGKVNGQVRIHQYVNLDDTAFGNGNFDPSGRWDEWGYPLTLINDQTISIEHQDHNGDDKTKGIVLPEVQQASQKLQALLRYGTIGQWERAGLRFRNPLNVGIIHDELRSMPLDGRHIITHHDIAGDLKPFCWMPWAKDDKGFPRNAYLQAITGFKNILIAEAVPEPEPEPTPTPPVVTYTQAQMDQAKAVAYAEGLAKGVETATDPEEIARLNAILDQIENLAADNPA